MPPTATAILEPSADMATSFILPSTGPPEEAQVPLISVTLVQLAPVSTLSQRLSATTASRVPSADIAMA